MSVNIEHRAVTGAIPARLKTVPVQVAADMGAACGVQVQRTGVVAVRRDLFKPAPDDRAIVRASARRVNRFRPEQHIQRSS